MFVDEYSHPILKHVDESKIISEQKPSWHVRRLVLVPFPHVLEHSDQFPHCPTPKILKSFSKQFFKPTSSFSTQHCIRKCFWAGSIMTDSLPSFCPSATTFRAYRPVFPLLKALKLMFFSSRPRPYTRIWILWYLFTHILSNCIILCHEVIGYKYVANTFAPLFWPRFRKIENSRSSPSNLRWLHLDWFLQLSMLLGLDSLKNES